MKRGLELSAQQLFALVYSLKGKSLRASWDQRKHIAIELPLEKDTVPSTVTEKISTELMKATHAYLGEEAVSVMQSISYRSDEPETLAQIQEALDRLELDRREQGDGELWQVVADHLGLNWLSHYRLTPVSNMLH
ncbi:MULTISPECIES: hypothetical protein [Mesorhizobium]|uniref:Uncharacterized protein n=1 Tax=Mesorhizobium denitrificans TaxID=2294114 RepID=A0A371XF86_9HYPH|nr:MULTISPECIES: hypothetical protein [Mesorhizobium]RFC67897.1 hypothetical protein DY251_09965 [Mesorhizobium denitrificans]